MTVAQIRAARDNAQTALNAAMASLAASEPTSVPGGKPNTTGSNTVDHAGTIAQLRETIKFYDEILIRREGAQGIVASYDC